MNNKSRRSARTARPARRRFTANDVAESLFSAAPTDQQVGGWADKSNRFVYFEGKNTDVRLKMAANTATKTLHIAEIYNGGQFDANQMVEWALHKLKLKPTEFTTVTFHVVCHEASTTAMKAANEILSSTKHSENQKTAILRASHTNWDHTLVRTAQRILQSTKGQGRVVIDRPPGALSLNISK